MNIDDKKSIFKVSLSDRESSWSNKEVFIVANDYNHAKDLAEEYVKFEMQEGANLLDSDGSLNTEKKEHKVVQINEVFNRVVF